MSQPSKTDLMRMIAEMGFMAGTVKAEAEHFMGINSSCVSIRHATANDLLAKLDQWQDILGALVEDNTPVGVQK